MQKILLVFIPVILLLACKDKPENYSTETTKLEIVKVPIDSSDAVEASPATQPAVGDEKTHDAIIATVKQVKTHIPDGFEIMDTCSGDLNLDGIMDYLILLRKVEEVAVAKATDSTIKRRLLILTGTGESYHLAGQSDNAVYCVNCGGMMGDPYQEMVIKKGYFSIEHCGGSSWRWTRTVTFKYSKEDSTWYLHKDGGESYHASDPDKVKTKVRTVKDFGKVPFTAFDIYKDE